ncbi:MAG TPA: hypothetical protein VNB64_11905 [Solirubrobacteraceae bacterium]|nr:hypothetical protein [Solirubrobacteraceae bacterium]
MSRENVDLMRRVLHAFNGRDQDAFLALVDEEVEAESRPVAMEGGYETEAEALEASGREAGPGS